jgi:predicted MFS family arabinose efflux permease
MTGWTLYAVIYFLFGFAVTPWHAWALFLAYAIYYALTEPAEKTLVANLAGVEQKGLAFGWFNLIVGIGAWPASLLFGAIYEFAGPVAAFATGAALALVSMALLATLRDSRQS